MSENDKVQVTVIKGTVATSKDGTFEKGEVFTTTRGEAAKLDSSFIQISELTVASLEENPLPIEPKKPSSKKKASAVEL